MGSQPFPPDKTGSPMAIYMYFLDHDAKTKVQQKEGKTNGKTGRQEDSHILAISDVK
jgi:hypothetical protein